MDTYQKRLPFAKEGQKWVPMKRIFSLEEQRA
jgi:L-rhamnose mutarotase